MADETRSDVKINGDGSLSGGTYGAVTINGAGTVNGDIDCTDYRVNGAGTHNGRLLAQSITVNGTGTFNGEVQANELNVNGDMSVRDGIGVGKVSIKGNASFGGSIASHEVIVRGFMKTGGDCQSEAFDCEGAFTVAGLLNAGTVDIKLYGPSSAREIGGEKIIVRQPSGGGLSSLTQIFTFWAEKRLTADSIEGDDVALELTTAKTVRGRNITIGEGCRVDLVEYSGTYVAAPGATVGEARQVTPAG